jgi:hypothetical protein
VWLGAFTMFTHMMQELSDIKSFKKKSTRLIKKLMEIGAHS